MPAGPEQEAPTEPSALSALAKLARDEAIKHRSSRTAGTEKNCRVPVGDARARVSDNARGRPSPRVQKDAAGTAPPRPLGAGQGHPTVAQTRTGSARPARPITITPTVGDHPVTPATGRASRNRHVLPEHRPGRLIVGMVNVVDLDRRAAIGTAALIDATSPDQYAPPTTWTDWTGRDLLTHLIAGNVKYVEIGRGKEWSRASPSNPSQAVRSDRQWARTSRRRLTSRPTDRQSCPGSAWPWD